MSVNWIKFLDEFFRFNDGRTLILKMSALFSKDTVSSQTKVLMYIDENFRFIRRFDDGRTWILRD